MEDAWTIWFTGLHGSGKSTIANRLAGILKEKDVPFVLLDGDELRKTISSDLGYSLEERNEHMRRVAHLCKKNPRNGILTIASVASPTEKSRAYAKKLLKRMFLVYVKCPLDVCLKRDVKGHYKKAKDKEKGFEHFMKVSSSYEEPKNPDIILYTDKESVEESVKRLVGRLKERNIISKEGYIDLHTHTTASDGVLTPAQLVSLAIKKGLKAIAITDHDSVSGVKEAMNAAKGKIEVISGVEISCDDPGFVDTHILGLNIDPDNRELKELLKKAQQYREDQKKAIIERFRELGFRITYQEVRRLANGEIGRPHIAKTILKNNPGKVASINQVFDEYLAVGKKAYIERKDKISIGQAIKAIHAAKGLAFIAHPDVYSNIDIPRFIRLFVKEGGDGIETVYAYDKTGRLKNRSEKEPTETIDRYRRLAEEHRLLETGGSDFHGKESDELGKLKVPYEFLEQMRKR